MGDRKCCTSLSDPRGLTQLPSAQREPRATSELSRLCTARRAKRRSADTHDRSLRRIVRAAFSFFQPEREGDYGTSWLDKERGQVAAHLMRRVHGQRTAAAPACTREFTTRPALRSSAMAAERGGARPGCTRRCDGRCGRGAQGDVFSGRSKRRTCSPRRGGTRTGQLARAWARLVSRGDPLAQHPAHIERVGLLHAERRQDGVRSTGRPLPRRGGLDG